MRLNPNQIRRARRTRLDAAVLLAVKTGSQFFFDIVSDARRVMMEERTPQFEREVDRTLQRLRKAELIVHLTKAQGGPGWFPVRGG